MQTVDTVVCERGYVNHLANRHGGLYALGYLPPSYPVPTLLGMVQIEPGYVVIQQANQYGPDFEYVDEPYLTWWNKDIAECVGLPNDHGLVYYPSVY